MQFALVPDHSVIGIPVHDVIDEVVDGMTWPTGSVVLGISTPDGTAIRGFGAPLPAHPATTVFEAGSLTKLFTATLLADAVNRGELSLDDPVRVRLPGARLPTSGGEMNLMHLATHTSGLPLFPPRVEIRGRVRYARLAPGEAVAALAGVRLLSPPGQQVVYSNWGFGLLGSVLEARTGLPFPALVRERITAPLSLTDTTADLSAEQRRRLAPGWTREGHPAQPWPAPNLAGALGLHTTVNDQLRFASAHFAGPLAAAARVTQKQYVADSSQNFTNGLGWLLTLDPIPGAGQVRWMYGRTGGYSSYVGVLPQRELAFVALSNIARSATKALGVRGITHLAAVDLALRTGGVAPAPAPWKDSPPVDALGAKRLHAAAADRHARMARTHRL